MSRRTSSSIRSPTPAHLVAHGALYLVDHTGTRRLRMSEREVPTSRVELWFDDVLGDWAA